jgi:hypothetical protein
VLNHVKGAINIPYCNSKIVFIKPRLRISIKENHGYLTVNFRQKNNEHPQI